MAAPSGRVVAVAAVLFGVVAFMVIGAVLVRASQSDAGVSATAELRTVKVGELGGESTESVFRIQAEEAVWWACYGDRNSKVRLAGVGPYEGTLVVTKRHSPRVRSLGDEALFSPENASPVPVFAQPTPCTLIADR